MPFVTLLSLVISAFDCVCNVVSLRMLPVRHLVATRRCACADRQSNPLLLRVHPRGRGSASRTIERSPKLAGLALGHRGAKRGAQSEASAGMLFHPREHLLELCTLGNRAGRTRAVEGMYKHAYCRVATTPTAASGRTSEAASVSSPHVLAKDGRDLRATWGGWRSRGRRGGRRWGCSAGRAGELAG